MGIGFQPGLDPAKVSGDPFFILKLILDHPFTIAALAFILVKVKLT